MAAATANAAGAMASFTSSTASTATSSAIVARFRGCRCWSIINSAVPATGIVQSAHGTSTAAQRDLTSGKIFPASSPSTHTNATTERQYTTKNVACTERWLTRLRNAINAGNAVNPVWATKNRLSCGYNDGFRSEEHTSELQ